MRRALTLSAGVALIAAAAWMGCGSSSAPTADEAVPPEAGGDSEAPEVDAAFDASGADAASFDGWGSPCIGAEHFFCDDFDHDGGLQRMWGGAEIILDGGAIDVGASPPGVAAPSTPNIAWAYAAPSSEAVVQLHTIAAPNGLHCALAIRVEQRGADSAVPIGVRIGSPNVIPPYYQAELELGGDGSDSIGEFGMLSDGGTFATYKTPIAALPLRTWVWFSFDVSIGARPIVNVAVNGVQVVAQPHYDLTQYARPTHEMLTIGLLAASGGAPWTVLFDNVVCDPIP